MLGRAELRCRVGLDRTVAVAVGTLAVLRWLEGGRRSNYISVLDSRLVSLKVSTTATLKSEEANNCSPFLDVRVSRVKRLAQEEK